jgi:zinc ribbon protein
MNEQMHCPRCGTINVLSARFCQQCGLSLLGPAGAKGGPNPVAEQPTSPTGQPTTGPAGQQPQGPGQPNWGQTALGGLAGFVLGSMLGGGRGLFGGWGGGGDWDDRDGGGFGGDGGDWGGGGGDG